MSIKSILLWIAAVSLANVPPALARIEPPLFFPNVYIPTAENPSPTATTNVRVENGRIVKIGPEIRPAKNDRVIKGKGRFLIPGLIDTHVHLGGVPGYRPQQKPHQHSAHVGSLTDKMESRALAQIPRSYLYFGFTTLLDLASNKDAINTWNDQELAPKAHFCTATPIVNGYPLAWVPPKEQFNSPMASFILYDPSQKNHYPASFKPSEHSPEKLAARAKKEGARCIKIFHETGFGRLRNLPVPSKKLARTMISEAEKHGLKVFLHGNRESAYRFAIDTKVHTIAHGMWHRETLPSSEELSRADVAKAFAKDIRTSGIRVQPTIQVVVGELETFNSDFFKKAVVQKSIPSDLREWYQSQEGQWMRNRMAESMEGGIKRSNSDIYQMLKKSSIHIDNVKQMTKFISKEGGSLVFGSDTPSGPFYTQFPGVNAHFEMQQWVNSGVELTVLFKALTIDNARLLGLENEIGSVETNKKANLLLLNNNPLKSVNAYNTIEWVILNGRAISRNLLAAD